MDFLQLPELTPQQVQRAVVYGFLASIAVWDLVWRRFRPTWGERLLLGVIANFAFSLINTFALGPVVMVGVTAFQGWFASLGLPHVPASWWEPMPRIVLVLLGMIAIDFCDYWNHRLLHTRWFWPIHAIHHSDPDVTATTTNRVHVLEPPIMFVSYTLMLSWLGLPSVDAGVAFMFTMIVNHYVHVNVDWHHGPARYLLASPRWHRWHHADVPSAHGKNFANMFPFWDLIFGTFHEPGPCREKVGAEGVPQNNVPLLVVWPFLEWSRMIADAVRRPGRAG